MISIATWNVNSVKSRLPHVLAFLKQSAPDIVLLQETKVMNEGFPAMEIEELGYNLALHGQKTYNGVAILSKYALHDVITSLPGDPSDEASRYIEAVVSTKTSAFRVASVYVPNGQEVGSDKFSYKLSFYDRLYAHLAQLLTLDEVAVIGGDYNVAPAPLDVHAPELWEGRILFSAPERAKLHSLLNLGYYDAFRTLHPDARKFSWWDYRANSRERNEGVRIDHLLLSPQATDKLTACDIEDQWRDLEKPSDHTPVVCRLDI